MPAAYDRPLKRRKAMKRTIYKVPRKPKSLSTVYPARGLVKKKQVAIMRYFERSNISWPVLGVPQNVVYRVNGLHDPEDAVGGQQPRGYDELSALYKKYRVRRACIEVWAVSANSSTGGNLIITMKNNNAHSAAIKTVMEDPESVIGLMSSEKPVYLKKEVDLRKYMLDYDVDDYVGEAGSTLPHEQYFFHVSAVDLGSAGGTTNPVAMNIRVTYEAEFFDPKTPLPS